jgi:hypothetical protein
LETQELLESASCLDYPSWLQTIKKVAEFMASNLPYQLHISAKGLQFGFFEKFKTRYEKPDQKMKKLLRDYQIMDIFVHRNGDFYMTCKKGTNVDDFIQANLEGKDLNRYVNFRLLGCYHHTFSTKNPTDLLTYANYIGARLKNASYDMKASLQEYIEAYPESKAIFEQNVFFKANIH